MSLQVRSRYLEWLVQHPAKPRGKPAADLRDQRHLLNSKDPWQR